MWITCFNRHCEGHKIIQSNNQEMTVIKRHEVAG